MKREELHRFLQLLEGFHEDRAVTKRQFFCLSDNSFKSRQSMETCWFWWNSNTNLAHFHQGPIWRTTSSAPLPAETPGAGNGEILKSKQNVPETNPPWIFRSLADRKRGVSVSAQFTPLRHHSTWAFFSNNATPALCNSGHGTSQKEEVIQKPRMREWHLITPPWQALTWHCLRWNTCYVKPKNFTLVQRCL